MNNKQQISPAFWMSLVPILGFIFITATIAYDVFVVIPKSPELGINGFAGLIVLTINFFLLSFMVVSSAVIMVIRNTYIQYLLVLLSFIVVGYEAYLKYGVRNV